MNIAVFTSNQPRHISLVEALASIADTLYVFQEITTLFSGHVADFYPKSEVMQWYFSHVMAAERAVFGQPRFLPKGVRQLAMKYGDLNRLDIESYREALEVDVVVVFGASYVKPPLVDLLIEKQAVNIHMGISPQYRGSSTNFWALCDGHPEFVGATIHRLSRGLDSGDILFHALPAAGAHDPFALGMLAVRAAHRGLIRKIQNGNLLAMSTVSQDRTRQLRYSRDAEFTDSVAAEYLARLPEPPAIEKALADRQLDNFIAPFVDSSP